MRKEPETFMRCSYNIKIWLTSGALTTRYHLAGSCNICPPRNDRRTKASTACTPSIYHCLLSSVSNEALEHCQAQRKESYSCATLLHFTLPYSTLRSSTFLNAPQRSSTLLYSTLCSSFSVGDFLVCSIPRDTEDSLISLLRLQQ